MSELETVTVYLWDDEWYPVYSVDDDGTSVRHFASKVGVPREQYDRWRAADEAFNAAQKEMTEAFWKGERP